MDIKEKMVRSLKNDCDVLLSTKIPKALENISDEKGVNTYRNLTRALAENVKLIEELEKDDYKPMWSIYETDANEGNLTPQVAVWMQNGKGDISNHQVFDIDYGIKADAIDGGETECDLRTTLVELIRDTIHECNIDKSCNAVFDKNDKFKDFEENLKSVIENFSINGKIIIPTSEAIRGVGKTTFLVKQAIENDGVYVGASIEQSRNAQRIAQIMFGRELQTLKYNGCAKIAYKKPLYIDEGVDLNRFELDKSKYVAFKYIPLNSL